MKRVVCCFVCVVFGASLFGQDSSATFSRFMFRPSVGINLPVTRLLKGDLTDDLFQYDDRSISFQFISLDYFFSKNWGIGGSFQVGMSKRANTRKDHFNKAMEQRYGEEYFITPYSSLLDQPTSAEVIERGYLSLIYRMEKRRWLFMPSFSLGVTSFFTDWAALDLKRKGSNGYAEVSISSGERANDHLTLAPSFTVGFHLSRRISLNADLHYVWYRTRITYLETFRDLVTEAETQTRYEYNRSIHSVNVSVGLIAEFWTSPLKRKSWNPW